MIGIYCWTNKLNGQKYVGQSIDIMRRKYQHEHNWKVEPSAIHAAMEKYGLENFIFTILEECSVEELDAKEQFWIAALDSYKHGYNCNKGGQQNSVGEDNSNTQLTNLEVLNIRNRVYKNHEEPKDIYEKEYASIMAYSSFWSMVHGDTWKNVDTSMIYTRKPNVTGSKNPRAKLTEEDVKQILIRKYKNKEGTTAIYQDYKDRISYSAFEKIALRETWKHVKIDE